MINIEQKAKQFKTGVGVWFRKVLKQVNRYPGRFLAVTALLVAVLIVAGRLWRQKDISQLPKPPAKSVNVYQVGRSPRIELMARVQKSGVVKVLAQTGGVVQKIMVKSGDQVYRGQALAYISSNYTGSSALVLQSQIAQTQYQHAKDSFDPQKELIAKQKQLANTQEENQQELREISRQAVDDTRSLIDLNQEIVGYLDRNLELYEASNSAGVNRDLIYNTKQLKSSYASALNQLRSSLRSTEYQSSEDEPPSKLSQLQKEITLKQLELQEKSLELNLELSRLQSRLAQVNASLAYPSAPAKGIVQKVHVKFGQTVSPGQVLITLKTEDQNIKLSTQVPKAIAQKVSLIEPSFLDEKEIYPSFVSQEATDGTLYNLEYHLTQDQVDVADGEQVTLSVPLGVPDTNGTIPLIPIDSVYQINDRAFVYVVKDEKAKNVEVELGSVQGRLVSVESGLESEAQLILDRSVVNGDQVKVIN